MGKAQRVYGEGTVKKADLTIQREGKDLALRALNGKIG